MKKAQFAVIVLLVLVLIALAVLIVLQFSNPFITGKAIIGTDKTSGSGNVVSKTFDLSDFNEVEIRGKGDLFVSQGEEYSVRVVAEDNLFSFLNPRIEGNRLVVGERKVLFYNTEPIKIYVKMPYPENLIISGSGNINSQSQINVDRLEITISGSSKINMDLDVNELETKISGSGEADYAGKSAVHKISISGRGTVDAFELESQETDVSITGSGDVEVYANEELDIKIGGLGDVKYKGSPKITQSIAGRGKVESMN